MKAMFNSFSMRRCPPSLIDESDALEYLAMNFESIFYETRDRMASKGKGKGKKGKGKHGSTYGSSGKPSFGGGKGHGGYLAHRRMLQATRNARGYDQPWRQRQGSRMSLADLKSRSRCHQCKQVGHWSRECPHRSKPTSPSRSATASNSSTSAGGVMATGFFAQTPKVAGDAVQYLTLTDEPSAERQYMPCSPVSNMYLSFVFLGTNKAEGTALVDTAAQHGLVGLLTLQAHEQMLEERFGLKIQWSHESGGVVRGVCGAEESTKIAYVPIGLGGKSGVLRVQVVPGDIPFLLPAYFLTDLEAVIDMKHATIMYMKIGVKQEMRRLSTGHVAASVIEFGNGFRVPTNFAFCKSQAWSAETVPSWSDLAPAYASSTMASVAALVAAALHFAFPARVADVYGGGKVSTTSFCAADCSAQGEA